MILISLSAERDRVHRPAIVTADALGWTDRSELPSVFGENVAQFCFLLG